MGTLFLTRGTPGFDEGARSGRCTTRYHTRQQVLEVIMAGSHERERRVPPSPSLSSPYRVSHPAATSSLKVEEALNMSLSRTSLCPRMLVVQPFFSVSSTQSIRYWRPDAQVPNAARVLVALRLQVATALALFCIISVYRAQGFAFLPSTGSVGSRHGRRLSVGSTQADDVRTTHVLYAAVTREDAASCASGFMRTGRN